MNRRDPRRIRILSEETVRTAAPPGGGDGENPYWLAEEPAPEPPAKEQGCIRRGLCCRSSPGWFAPGEVERAAELLGILPDDFVRRFVVLDSVSVDGVDVRAFTPVKLDRFGAPALEPPSRVDALYRALRGACVFFDGAGCRIYEARPLECRRYLCSQSPEESLTREQIGRMWLLAQTEVA